jgi:phosphatidylglycerol:prolipoprotein diacylglycerol transferase
VFVWNASPEIFHVGPVAVRWYSLMFAISFYLGTAFMERVFRIEGKPQNDISTLLITMIAGTVIGARLGHVLFYEPGYYLTHPLQILMVWRGGLASHGGAIGILLALFLYTRRRPEQSFLWLIDRIVIPVALAGFFIRIGNFFNSEIIGRPTDLPWAVIFSSIDSLPRHPSQLYEAFAYLLIFAVLFLQYQKFTAELPRGYTSGLFFILIFGARFLIEFLKEHQVGFESALPLDLGQLLSIPFVILGIVLWRGSLHQKKEEKKT